MNQALRSIREWNMQSTVRMRITIVAALMILGPVVCMSIVWPLARSFAVSLKVEFCDLLYDMLQSWRLAKDIDIAKRGGPKAPWIKRWELSKNPGHDFSEKDGPA